MSPSISEHYQQREPSAIRKAQFLFNSRKDKKNIEAINLAIGNITLPMHPIMIERMNSLDRRNSPFHNGVVKYTSSVGTQECQSAFIHSIDAELTNDISNKVKCVVTDGGSQAMELMLLGVCGPSSKKPILFIDPTYTNYIEFSKRLSIPITIFSRKLQDDGSYSDININEISNIIDVDNPCGIVLIPGDNPTGQQISQELITEIAKVCVEKDIWIISDEAYRSLYYTEAGQSSIWALKNDIVPGINGRRISIESSSKMWNACGLRIGALVTDNQILHNKVASEYTANLCANVIGQYIFGSISTLSKNEIRNWYQDQRTYYYSLIKDLREELLINIPGIIVSNPESALYLVIDFKNIVDDEFNIINFIEYCARKGKCMVDKNNYTILLAPMTGFYFNANCGKTQARIAIVESKSLIEKVPHILSKLIKDYLYYLKLN
jgi:aspartate aminotransferase